MVSPLVSIQQRLLRSSLAAYGSQLGRTAIRLVADLALARLVLDEDHGLFAQALAIVVMLGLVRDLGLPFQLVRDERQPFATVLLWSVGSSLVLIAGLVLGGSVFSGLDPRLPEVLRYFAPWLLLEGLAMVPRIYFERQLTVERLVAPEILRGLTFAAVSVLLAMAGGEVWSFVAGEIVAAALFAVLVWKRAWGQMPFELRPGLLPDLLRRSGFLFLVALAAVSAPYAITLVLGGLAPSAVVGWYDKARLWAFRLQILVLPAVARVLYPALQEYRYDPPRFAQAYRLATLSILGVETLAAYFLFFNAEVVLLEILLGPAWQGVVPLLKILCLAPLVDPFTRLGGELLKVRQEDRVWLLAVVLNLVSLLYFGVLLFNEMGVEGIAWANYLLVGNLLMTWRIWRICGRDFWRLAGDLLFVYTVCLPAYLLAAWLFPPASWSRFAASVVAAGLGGAILLARFYRPFRDFFGHPGESPEEGPGESPEGGTAHPGSGAS